MAKTLAGATLVLMIMNMAARLLGFFRETAVAAVYGASGFTDAYQVAYTLPYFLQMVLGMALVSSIVPVIVQNLKAGKKQEAWQAASITINLTAVLMVVLAVLGVLFVPAFGTSHRTGPAGRNRRFSRKDDGDHVSFRDLHEHSHADYRYFERLPALCSGCLCSGLFQPD